ncbi:MAG TPA: hypothetical protein VF950_24900 [Planctomycetota bacterium]
MTAVLDVLYAGCDLLFGWTAFFGATGALTIVGVLSGLAVILFQKYASDQDLLGRCKADLKILKARMKAAKRDPEGARRLQGLSGRIGGKYMWAALKPALWTVPIIGVVGLWAGARLAYLPPRPNEPLKVVAHFEDAAEGWAHVVPGDGFAVEGPAIAAAAVPDGALGKQAAWTVKALGGGERTLRIRHGGRTYEVRVPGSRPPDLVTVFGAASPRQDRLQAVELKLADSVPSAWWNLWLQWGGLYLVAAMVVALLLRRVMKVQ